MSKSYEAIKQYLDDQEWRYDYREEDEYFIMRMNMQSVDSCTCIIQLKENDDFTVYSIFPLKVAQDKLAAAAEYILNWISTMASCATKRPPLGRTRRWTLR